MSIPAYPRDELHRLASALCDGAVSREQARRLESLATQSPEALNHFVHYAELHAELAWMLGTAAEPMLTTAREPAKSAPC